MARSSSNINQFGTVYDNTQVLYITPPPPAGRICEAIKKKTGPGATGYSVVKQLMRGVETKVNAEKQRQLTKKKKHTRPFRIFQVEETYYYLLNYEYCT